MAKHTQLSILYRTACGFLKSDTPYRDPAYQLLKLFVLALTTSHFLTSLLIFSNTDEVRRFPTALPAYPLRYIKIKALT
jgi:hypothetical protein